MGTGARRRARGDGGGASVELEGTIGQFSLRELIEMVVYSSVTGVLTLGGGEEAGRIYFRDGLPYDARAAEATGFDAAALLFELRDVPFHFVAGSTSQEETLWMDPWELIERGEEHARIWSGLRPFIPGLDWVPAVLTSPVNDHVHISDVAWPVLAAVDGQRSVAEIGEHLELATVDVCTGLVELLRQHLIALHPPRPPHPPAPPAPEEPQDEGGFFERLIARTLEEERRRTSDPSAGQISDPDVQARVGRE
ncbi:MAG TPA: DUF4388 domain-containing protein [Roseiflexaceae bacterium]|nr:DUF4388 domain-containing protein [Roseiflexaceae bacterium]